MGDRVRANVTASASVICLRPLQALVNPLSVTDSDDVDLPWTGAWFEDDAVIARANAVQDLRPL